jgi:hypothetical protein
MRWASERRGYLRFAITPGRIQLGWDEEDTTSKIGASEVGISEVGADLFGASLAHDSHCHLSLPHPGAIKPFYKPLFAPTTVLVDQEFELCLVSISILCLELDTQ